MGQQITERRLTSDSQLLTLIQEISAELHPHRTPLPVALDTAFDRELGLDSLARVELLARIERRFGVTLPETVFATAETPRELLLALGGAPNTVDTMPIATAPVSESGVVAPVDARTLIEVLDWYAQRYPARTTIRVLNDPALDEEVSYGTLRREAVAVAGNLQRLGLSPGHTVAIMLPTGHDYFTSFFGVLLAGAIPVPIYPPARPALLEEHVRRHAVILTNCEARMLITVPEAKIVARLLRSHVETLDRVVTPTELADYTHAPITPVVNGDDIALLQYTSGSTANPKGVILTHAQLMANIRAMGKAVQATPADVFVSWLPLYHDMGLIGAWLATLYHAIPLAIMSPLTFLAHPDRWLRAIHRCGGTLSAAPNFAFELCLRRVDNADIKGLDLSRWRVALNGAEPVNPDTLERFSTRFAHYGLPAEAMTPVYGLAEVALGLTFPPLNRGPRVDRIQRAPLTRSGQAVPAASDDATALRFVACGVPLPDYDVRIVDAAGHELPERHEGRLQFRGPSATRGYFRNPEATKCLFDGDWIESGDLAYMAEGEIHLTGRIKDLIILAGRNIYPEEIETVVANLPDVRKNCVAVFGSPDPKSGTERLVVLAETRRLKEPAVTALRARINAAVIDLIGVAPDDVCLAPPRSVLKTSSGKIRRAASRELYEQGKVGREPASPAWQLVKLAASAVAPQWRRAARAVRARIYAVYVWSVFAPTMVVTWLLVALLPRASWRWAVMRTAARTCAAVCRLSPRVVGLANLPARNRPCVLAANHASYLDGFLLVAALPRAVRFVAKVELRRQFFAGTFLRRIDTTFVERFDRREARDNARQMTRSAHARAPLLFFPEGTFSRRAGLRPFHLGAFTVAAEAGVPVVPIAINGARAILRDGSWWPRRATVTIVIDPPIEPAETGATDTWGVALALRDATRAHILRHAGEPDRGHDITGPAP